MELKELTEMELFPDRMTIGTPAKGGELKISFNADKPDEAKVRIDNAIKALSYAKAVRESVEVSNGKQSNE